MKNQVQLIAYVDRLGGGRLEELERLLCGPLADLFGTVHLLPFFHRIDGADAGFDPIDHTRVDARLGNWQDIGRLAERVNLMADLIVNHISCESPQYQDFSAHGVESRYDGLFLTLDAVFPKGASEQDLTAVYRPRPGLPLTPVTLENGERRILWTTFTPQQIDIDVNHPQGRAYLEGILRKFSEHGITAIRLDAVGYAIKRAGSSCFMLPETFEFIGQLSALARSFDMEVLVEVHSHYLRQIEIAERVDWVYDFALPPLMLHALFNGTARYLKEWIEIRPRNALTVLDTHDGIGVIDIGPESEGAGRPGLLPEAQIDRLVDTIHALSRGQSRRATGAAASNLDLYQVNCAFYDALGRNAREYLLARAVQFFLPGIPQVYYVGLLGGGNDMELLERTGVGRDINRHRYAMPEVLAELERPVVQDLMVMIRLRNTHPAFQGTFSVGKTHEHILALRWDGDGAYAELIADLSTGRWSVYYGTGAQREVLSLQSVGEQWGAPSQSVIWGG